MVVEFKIYDDCCTVSAEITDEKKQKVVDEIIKWCTEHNCSSGESLCQKDETIIEAPYLIAKIIDDILEFKTSCNDED